MTVGFVMSWLRIYGALGDPACYPGDLAWLLRNWTRIISLFAPSRHLGVVLAICLVADGNKNSICLSFLFFVVFTFFSFLAF